MSAASFRVALSPEAEGDLYEIVDYWIERGEPWRGEKYSNDLNGSAWKRLSDPAESRRGRKLKSRTYPQAQEILAFGIYRIIYEIDEAAARVDILRFWHAHRDDPPFD